MVLINGGHYADTKGRIEFLQESWTEQQIDLLGMRVMADVQKQDAIDEKWKEWGRQMGAEV